MASFNKSINSSRSCATGVSFLILLSALMIVWSAAHADPGAPTSVPAPASSDAPQAAELTKEIQVQLARIVPGEMRIEGVSLGCKPPAGAVLKTVAPGITNLVSRSFMIELQTGDRTIFCSAMLDASRQLMTASHDLEGNAPVTAADFASNWVDAFSVAPGALASFPADGPYVSATSIRAGQAIYPSSLKHPTAVRPGDLVTVLVKNGPITVRAQLQAQTQASIGESATLINPGSGMPVTVTVTGPRTAELVMQ
jgi:flagella basal body P-ring formation protein FlgA